jgi:hypothetical protein
VAERHDDDHRLRFLLGNQVVEDQIRPPDEHPAGFDVAGAVQQVQKRKQTTESTKKTRKSAMGSEQGENNLR